MNLWQRWRRRPRAKLTTSEKEIRQVHRITREVVHTMLAEVGEDVLRETIAELEKNRKETGESNYTSLAEIWLGAKARAKALRRHK